MKGKFLKALFLFLCICVFCVGFSACGTKESGKKIDDEDEEHICEVFTEGLRFTLVNNEYYVTGYTGEEEIEVIIPSEYLELPVTTIGERAFYQKKITGVTIPNTIETIGEYAFFGCYTLVKVTIPESVTSIEYNAFSYAAGLTVFMQGLMPPEQDKIFAAIGLGRTAFTIVVPEAALQIYKESWSGLANKIFSNTNIDEGYIIEDNTILSYFGDATEIVIPEHITAIGDYAFCGNLSIKYVTICDNVASIGTYAFGGCSKLTVYMTSLTPPGENFSFVKWVYDTIHGGVEAIYVPASALELYGKTWRQKISSGYPGYSYTSILFPYEI